VLGKICSPWIYKSNETLKVHDRREGTSRTPIICLPSNVSWQESHILGEIGCFGEEESILKIGSR
jgi:hypothetical protein